ncbi:MAG: response regulator [Cyanobacteria bacterium SZAS LIN-3]|nr:response regulator [Cyanobacteria bacterium SZAS LIN-3]MBS2007194.1 response regulator [Cyanobacteria bacterium SZAS TMP-1]
MLLPTPVILIINQPRQAAEFASVLEKTGSKVHAVTSFEEANELLSFLHPDIIILPNELGGANAGDGRLYCQQIRATLAPPRPVLVLLHPSTDVTERINAFRYGADDVLGDPIDKNELAVRVIAHLRRRQEEFSSQLTQLPGPNLIRRMLDQCLISDKQWAALSVDLNKIRVYNETYGDLAGDQLIKALAAILVDCADDNEFVGHIEADDFLMVTRPEVAERKAELICQQFDSISSRFYPKGDIARGYLISTGRGGIRRRVPLISIAIGIVNSTVRKFQSYVDVLTTARDYRYLAKQSQGSFWVSDRSGSAHPLPEPPKPAGKDRLAEITRILVVEPDGAMACLLQETLALEGYFVQVTSSADDALELARYEPRPDLILLESNLTGRKMDGWKLCRELKSDEELSRIWIVMATSHPDQSLALEAGADLYLPKPFDMPSLLNEVNLLLRSRS